MYWKQIPGAMPGYEMCFETDEVRSPKSKTRGPVGGKILTPSVLEGGRKRYCYHGTNGRYTTQMAARMKWQTFIGPVDTGDDIHHKDSNPSNDAWDNLECVDHALHCGDHIRKYYANRS